MADIKKNKQKVRYEFYRYDNPNPTNYNLPQLKLEEPAEIKFVFISTVPGTFCIINNIFIMNSLSDYVSGVATSPYELILKNNINEYDVSSYSINMTNLGTLLVVCKYYVS
jgi:hypothetical protein